MTAASTETVWAQFHEALRRFILSRVSDEQVADDILQDVFVRIHAKIEGLRDDAKLESWVFQIARNAITDHYRRTRPSLELDDTEPMPGPEDDTERRLGLSLRGMILLLPPADREVLEMTAFEGLSQTEIADRLGISYSGAKSRVQRARARLRDAFLACCNLEFDRIGGVVDFYPHGGCQLQAPRESAESKVLCKDNQGKTNCGQNC